jgi:hypothetical protein
MRNSRDTSTEPGKIHLPLKNHQLHNNQKKHQLDGQQGTEHRTGNTQKQNG